MVQFMFQLPQIISSHRSFRVKQKRIKKQIKQNKTKQTRKIKTISPQDVAPVTGIVPNPAQYDTARGTTMQRSLDYMGLTPGMALDGLSIDKVLFYPIREHTSNILKMCHRLYDNYK